MTTYYGVWSGEEWLYRYGPLFHTASVAVARARAANANAVRKRQGGKQDWEVRAIGEDGLPTSKPSLTEAQKQIRSEAASYKCELCDKVATNWIELPQPYRAVYFCDRHEAWGTLFSGPFPVYERREL